MHNFFFGSGGLCPLWPYAASVLGCKISGWHGELLPFVSKTHDAQKIAHRFRGLESISQPRRAKDREPTAKPSSERSTPRSYYFPSESL